MDELEDRYNKWYKVSENNSIYLSEYTPDRDDCRILLYKIIEQAVRDYVNLYRFIDNKSIENWESAVSFLFEEEYYIDWGDYPINLKEILAELDIDLEWFRDRTDRKFEEINGGKEK